MVTKQDIVLGLRALGLPPGAAVLVHSSLKSFGYVEGGAETVIAALTEALDGGTLVLPTLSFRQVSEAAPVFDVQNTPSDTGLITETFRRQPGVLRSRHIFSSAAARGPDAAHIAGGHLDTPAGPDSPYWRVMERGGYVLFLGAGFGSNTVFHCAEEAVEPDYLRYAVIPGARVIQADGSIMVHDFRRYNCSQTGIIRYLINMEAVYRAKNAVRDAVIGESRVMLISAADNFEIACELLRRDPGFILKKPEV